LRQFILNPRLRLKPEAIRDRHRRAPIADWHGDV
jgi:hypothetical protein